MWNIFRKRKESQFGAPSLPACIHTWKDFPWYMKRTWEENPVEIIDHFAYDEPKGTLTIQIIEPYVCAHCHERKNIILMTSIERDVSYKKIDKIAAQFFETYKDQIQPVAVVEDMINDFIYVDREKLDILDRLRQIKKKEGSEL
jgi:hypothetical protein